MTLYKRCLDVVNAYQERRTNITLLYLFEIDAHRTEYLFLTLVTYSYYLKHFPVSCMRPMHSNYLS